MEGLYYRNFKYSYTTSGNKEKHRGIVHGRSWQEAQAIAREHFPERLDLELIKEQMEATELVKGLQGYWHATDGSWDSNGDKLQTLCGTSISPNFRRMSVKKSVVNCPKCHSLLSVKEPVAAT